MQDICYRKHGGNEESNAAYERNSSVRDRQHEQILLALAQAPEGMNFEEIAEICGLLKHSCSGRLSRIKTNGLGSPEGRARRYLRRPTSSGSGAAVLTVSHLVTEALAHVLHNSHAIC
jgi:DNA-binding IclR family transcriptional regulator